jgi:Phage head-tail joining protein
MNPGILNKRLFVYKKEIINGQENMTYVTKMWGHIVSKQKSREQHRDNGRTIEVYEIVIRKRNDIFPYMQILHDDTWYDILTVEEKDRLYITLKCEKARVHQFYDVCKVSRFTWSENEDRETINTLSVIYPSIPCELIQLKNAATNETEQQTDINYVYILRMETKWNLQIGDTVEVQHRQDTYITTVQNFFRTHLYQEVALKLEGEA